MAALLPCGFFYLLMAIGTLRSRCGHHIFILSFIMVALCNTADHYIGSRPSDHYFRSVCLSVCLFVQFFSVVFDPISIKLGHMLYVWV